jgi:hypothetical protein
MIQIQQDIIDELCTKLVGQELGKTEDRCFSLFLTGDAGKAIHYSIASYSAIPKIESC